MNRHEVTLKRVRYEPPGLDAVTIRRQLEYAPGPDRTLDVYYPPGWTPGQAAPGVIIVSGLSDIGAQQFFGCRINQMESFISWGRLLAASGLIGITYTTGTDPADNLQSVLRHIAANGVSIGVDARGLGLLAVSSHVPNALGLLIARPTSIACAVLGYGFMLDLDGSTGVSEAQQEWRFSNPAAGKSVDDLPPDVALLVIRAGRDAFPQINPSIDRFVAHALRRNLPLTLLNHHCGPHAFDVDDDSEASKQVVKQMLTFLQAVLTVG